MKTTSENTIRSESNSLKINPQWRWHYRTLLKLREQLLHDRDIQRSEASEPVESHSLHQADSATDEFDREVSLSALSGEHDALYEIEQALKRINDGTYGICEQTHVPIPPERLKALPWTRFTKTAAESLGIAAAAYHHQIGPLSGETRSLSSSEEGGEILDLAPNDEQLHSIRIPVPPAKKVKRARNT